MDVSKLGLSKTSLSNMSFSQLKKYWETYGYEILVVGALALIIIASFFQPKKGTWSELEALRRPDTANERHEVLSMEPIEEKVSAGERECRRVLEAMYSRPFPKARPSFLQNPVTGGDYNLEIDCYCPELRLGVEYNGVQHYKYTPYFHKNREAFLNQKYRDEIKKRACQDAGVTLIVVPYTVKPKDIQTFLQRELMSYEAKKSA